MKETDQNKSNKMQVQKLPTGIEGFDDVCRGGLPTSRSTLVSGTSGTVSYTHLTLPTNTTV